MSNKIEEQAELKAKIRAFANDVANILVDYNGLNTEEFYEAEAELFDYVSKQKESLEKEAWSRGYSAGGASAMKILLENQQTLHAGRRRNYNPIQAVPVSIIERIAHLSSKETKE